MTARQLLVPESAFLLQDGIPQVNQDIYQAVTWAPFSPVVKTGRLRAYFEDNMAGEQLAQSLYDELIARGVSPVFKNWAS